MHVRGGLTMLCIAVFLFSYVNATMFWHGHNVSGYWFFHSHIASAFHRSAPTENSHTSAELLLIQALNQASYTEEAVFSCDLEPFRVIIETILTEPGPSSGVLFSDHVSLRGPPALV